MRCTLCVIPLSIYILLTVWMPDKAFGQLTPLEPGQPDTTWATGEVLMERVSDTMWEQPIEAIMWNRAYLTGRYIQRNRRVGIMPLIDDDKVPDALMCKGGVIW